MRSWLVSWIDLLFHSHKYMIPTPAERGAGCRYNRQVKKAKDATEEIASGFWELYYLALTFHGRKQLETVIQFADQGTVEVDPDVLRLYKYIFVSAPYQAYAEMN